jgi:hypothetical protein
LWHTQIFFEPDWNYIKSISRLYPSQNMESHEENKKYIENLQEFWISSSSLMDLHSQHAILPNLDDGEQQRWICCKRQDAESTINVHRKH